LLIQVLLPCRHSFIELNFDPDAHRVLQEKKKTLQPLVEFYIGFKSLHPTKARTERALSVCDSMRTGLAEMSWKSSLDEKIRDNAAMLLNSVWVCVIPFIGLLVGFRFV
jgi:hypothetical protein